ncbi:GntR family transcriptional regulator [Frigidibacter sp. ROC022]|uniref:GntR family transcriptional regulator n=1 Tax=Frigidibacter sp. ROC022 TaxID=2971796 RepID=UPI00215AF2A5|nr:GntR family transcriptional regulator [Frigidibacter sp. ROC022]MCR8723897.1 GntR family transcriptional regulator [Frigidibacter sp. ROC022]
MTTHSQSSSRHKRQAAALRTLAAEPTDPKDAGLPKYRRLMYLLQRMVDQGHWKPGDEILGERELARLMDVSLGTVQKALGLMADNGALVREHGRGTFVTGGRTPQEDIWYYRFAAEDETELLPIYARVLSLSVISERGPWSGFLQGADEFVRIRRLMSVNHEFDLFSEVYLDAGKFGRIAQIPPDVLHGAAIYRMLDKEFGMPTRRVAQQLRFRALPDEVVEELGLRKGTDGIELTILSYDMNNRPLMYQRAFIPPNDRVMQVSDMSLTVTRGRSGGALTGIEIEAPDTPTG